MSGNKLTHAEQAIFVFAARYSHTRETGGSMLVVEAILKSWDRLAVSTQEQIVKEIKSDAKCNMEDWEQIIEKNNGS